MASTYAKNQAVELVKAALGSGLIEASSVKLWLTDPERNGKDLGKLIAAAVTEITNELDKL